MSTYVNISELKIRLIGKVAFDDDGDDPNKLPTQLALQLLSQAEAEVELELSPRYFVPFMADSGSGTGTFSGLPRATKQLIKTLCLNTACLYILGTDFGRGSAVQGEKYGKDLKNQYDWIVERAIGVYGGKDKELEAFRMWKYPPLTWLQLAPHNLKSDDGYAGQIYKSGSNKGDYAADSVNDPSVTFWNATVNDILNPEAFGDWS